MIKTSGIYFPTGNIEKAFIIYADSSYVNQKVDPRGFQTTMPWTMYAGMSRADLGAMFEYLHGLTPVVNPVERFSPFR